MYNPKQTAYEQSAVTLQTFDFSAIEALDPSLSDGSRLLFDRELPAHIRFEDSPEQNEIIENVRVRILLQGLETKPAGVRVEVTSESDLFFVFIHAVNPTTFENVKESQHLNSDFKGYPNIIIKALNRCQNTDQCALFFVVRSDGSGLLSIIQFNEYKNVELLGLECEPGPEEFVRQHVAYQYGALKSKTSMMEGRLQDIAELVRAKNPSLLLQIQKTAVHSGEPAGKR